MYIRVNWQTVVIVFVLCYCVIW